MVRTYEKYTYSGSPYFPDRGAYGVAEPITERVNPHSRRTVSYYFPKGVGSYHFGERHPMKPHRLTLTNSLVMGYGLDKQIHEIFDARPATREELETYHDTDYIEYLSRVTPQNQGTFKTEVEAHNCGEDCPVFAGMYDFCRKYAGGTLAAARKLCSGRTDIAINWSGGLHHAKRGEASGFCYVNDIVLGILELLRYYPRVLYIDIDIHHGDGVELAFYHTNRVMTLSFHKYTGDFFPGTGKLDDNGIGLGKHFALNVPLKDGIDDKMYLELFTNIVSEVRDKFQPSAIVLQCGADSLGCDRLGAFNLSIKAHGDCVAYVRAFGLPLLVLGGGGYTVKNVSRCWAYETAVLAGASVPDALPRTPYDAFFADSGYTLHPPLTGRVDNLNTPASLKKIVGAVRNKLRYLEGAPSVQMQEMPPDLQGLLASEERSAEEQAEREKEDMGAGSSAVASPAMDMDVDS
ncbi:hypothetical protein BD626DRAFT_557650 [Schizophyllum amplum]|uniref:Histone deacetylase n=1 Tax=Schizophyllum amplum TaxID=97359 RepID=A0A550CET3_9AGAR|nr:hypothetical protein BD626DRAFT_557650 [Auriculariopsis ampla]